MNLGVSSTRRAAGGRGRLTWPPLRRRPLLLLGLVLLTLLAIFLASARWQAAAAGDALALTFSHRAGRYDEPFLLRLTAADSRAAIWYTLDGSPPLPGEAVRYRGALPVRDDSGMAVRAVAVSGEGRVGPEAAGSYLVGLDPGLPLLSLIVAPEDFDHPLTGIHANPQQRGREWERPVLVGFQEGDQGFQIKAGLRIHGGFSRELDKKSFRLYMRDEYGDGALTYPLFGPEPERFSRLVLHAGGQDTPVYGAAQWTLLRSPLIAALSAETKAPGPRDRAVFLLINGEPRGIYFVRERIDRRFLETHYGIEAADILDSPERIDGAANVVEGDRQHWDNLMDFVRTHDLSDPAHYAYVRTQVDVANLIDYTLVHLYAGNIDWPEGNVNQFRARGQGGRWRWMPWDNDHSLGYPPDRNSVTVNHVLRSLVHDDRSSTSGGQTILLRKLMEQPLFFERFLQRAAMLLNTTLAPDNVHGEIDRLAAQVRPAIAAEQEIWPSQFPWEEGIAALHTFADQRPEILRGLLSEQYALGGTLTVTVQAPASGAGQVVVNGQPLPGLPWRGVFFRQVPLTVSALPDGGYRFAGWLERPELGAAEGQITLAPEGDSLTLTPQFGQEDRISPAAGAVRISDVGIDDEGEIAGDWVLLEMVQTVDLRGWRLTDNDSLLASDEGSLILPNHPALGNVPAGSTLLLVAEAQRANRRRFADDDLDGRDGRLVLVAGNGLLDDRSDPWFNLHEGDNLALLAPGPTAAWDDDRLITFWSASANRSSAAFMQVDAVP